MGGRRATFPRSPAVSSPRRGLTSLFGMGRGAPPRHGRRSSFSRHFRDGRKKPRAAHTCNPRTRGGSRLGDTRDGCAGGPAFYFSARPPAFGPLVPLGSTRRRAPTCGLSTWSSPTALKGGLISGRASRLDALSAYPVRTRLPGCAPGGTTGTPLVRPTRSSRTKVSAPQASNARNR